MPTTRSCLQCYCLDEVALDPANEFRYYGRPPQQICAGYIKTSRNIMFWTKGVSYGIIFINFILREFCIKLINQIGFRTETERIYEVTKLTFIVQFLNTAILPLLANASFLGGQFSDFNTDWFRTTGNLIVSTMIFNAWYPLLEFVVYYLMRLLSRLLDSGFTLNKYNTKCRSVNEYVDIYSGPKFSDYIHFRYAAILNITFITMFYGFGLPLLFPIACVSFLVIYLTEMLLLFYSFKMPPSYNDTLSRKVLRILMWAPVFYLAFGYWMASSMQLMSNEYLTPIETRNGVIPSMHPVSSVFTQSGWETPKWILLVGFIALFILVALPDKLL